MRSEHARCHRSSGSQRPSAGNRIDPPERKADLRENPNDLDSAVAVTQLLNDAASGDAAAAAELLPLVYNELRRLARQKMGHERAGHTLQATALVHEAYVRLVAGNTEKGWQGRWQFFAAAAEAMRRILVDQARRRGRIKRGGGAGAGQRIDLEKLQLTVDEQPPQELLAIDEGLTALAEQHADKAQLVKLRYFAGLSIEEAAEAMGISVATANRHWAYARAWLFRHLEPGG
jgi:RNA polymerase sigma factor (TIGR02999 family)